MTRRLLIWVVSFVLALLVRDAVFRTPNHTAGGDASLFAFIFLLVGFKAGIELVLSRWSDRRRAAQAGEKTGGQTTRKRSLAAWFVILITISALVTIAGTQ